jgi:hypothetical protein
VQAGLVGIRHRIGEHIGRLVDHPRAHTQLLRYRCAYSNGS